MLMLTGEAIAHPNFATIIHDIALLNSLGVKLIIAHGARPQIEERVALRGVDSRFENDVRITDTQTLQCVKDAAGAMRADIEALLTMGLANSPMHGAQIRVCSGNFVIAKPIGIRNGVDYEHTGAVRRVDKTGIEKQLADGSVVLIPPIGYSPTGEVFNLSQEDVATQVAITLNADKLIVFSADNGLLNSDGELIPNCSVSQLKALLQQCEDMETTKLLTAISASVESTVGRCHCISYIDDGALLQELFTRDGGGTLITKDHYEQLRPATIDDVGGVLELIAPLEEQGVLVKRSRELLENEIHLFTVIVRDGMIIACAALYPYFGSNDKECSSGEIACVATHLDYRGEDRGERLLAAIEKQAKAMKLSKVFVLTTQTAHWFRELGFVQASLAQLPEKKQQLYNLQRNSKVFIKDLE